MNGNKLKTLEELLALQQIPSNNLTEESPQIPFRPEETESLVSPEMLTSEPNMSVGQPAQLPTIPSTQDELIKPKAKPSSIKPQDGKPPSESPEKPELSRMDLLLKEYEDRKKQREGGRTTASIVDALAVLSNIVNAQQPKGTGVQIEPQALKQLQAQEEKDYEKLFKERKDLRESEKEKRLEQYYNDQLAQQGKKIVDFEDGKFIVNLKDNTRQYLGPADTSTTDLFRQQRLDLAKEKKLDQDVEKLATKIDKLGLLPQANVFSNIETFLQSKNINLDDPKTYKDISGQGLLGKYRPDFTLDVDDVDFRQNIKEFGNALLKIRSGSAVTDQEAKRLGQELGTGVFSDEKSLLKALSRARKLMSKVSRSATTSFDKEAVETYKERTGLELPHEMVEKKEQAQKELELKDKQALDWAKSNSTDKRSPQILERLGMKYGRQF